MNGSELAGAYQRWHDQGMQLAGDRADGLKRAAVFVDLYRHSGRNHVFPLIAAHATLWVWGYAAIGRRLAWWLSWQYGLRPAWRQPKLAALQSFSEALLDINRRICAATYADYHFAARFGNHPDASLVIQPELIAPLMRIHAAREAGRAFSDDEKLKVFWPHFLHEQEFHVGPGMAAALAQLQWPLVKFLALRPLVRFAYFPAGKWIWFGNSLSHQQRVANGLRAFQAAVSAGWQRTEESLAEYGVSSAEILRNADPDLSPSDCASPDSNGRKSHDVGDYNPLPITYFTKSLTRQL